MEYESTLDHMIAATQYFQQGNFSNSGWRHSFLVQLHPGFLLAWAQNVYVLTTTWTNTCNLHFFKATISPVSVSLAL